MGGGSTGRSGKHERRRDDERSSHHRHKSSSNKMKRSREDDDREEDRHRDHDRKKDKRRGRDHDEDDDDRQRKRSSGGRKERKGEGGDRQRSRDKKKKRHSRDQSDSNEDSTSSTKRRKHRHSSKSRDEKRREHRSKKEKKKNSHKHHHDSRKEQKKAASNKKKRSLVKVDKSKLYPLGDKLGHPPEHLLDPEADYFAYHKHLWLYLYRDCSTVFNDLSSEEARNSFRKFCQLYNTGQLEAGYYSSDLPAAALEECKTTRHSWKFQISDREDKSLQALQEGVRKQTEYHGTGSASAPSNYAPLSSVKPTVAAPPPPRGDDNNERRRKTPEERQRERADNRRLREHVRTVHEELTGGRKEGRERELEKRRELSERMHGAARERDSAGIELNDDALFGDSDRSQLERSKQRTARREEKKQARVAELHNKEKEKQEKMLEMLGLSGKIKAGEKIQIAPRKDG